MARPFPAVLLVIVLLAPSAGAVNLYRYENEQGVIVMAYSVPPHLVHKGYTVLAEDGRVIEVVERELSPAEAAERDARLARERHDRELMRVYASTDDLAHEKERRMTEMRHSLDRLHRDLEGLQIRLRNYQRDAADMERRGEAPTNEVLANIHTVEQQIEMKRLEIVHRRDEIERAREQFDSDLARLRELYERG